MALNYDIILNKNIHEFESDFDGVGVVNAYDLLSVTFDPNFTSLTFPMIVEKEYVARPDLISLAKYGTDKYADVICKINGISNPFELNEGDMIFLPVETVVDSYTNVANYEDRYKGYIENEDESLGKKYSEYQRMVSDIRLTNEQIIGQTDYIIDRQNNVVYY